MQLLLMLAVAGLLFGWSLGGQGFSCGRVLALLIPVLGFVFMNMLEVAVMRRRAWVGMYLQPRTALAKFLCGKTLLLLWQLLKATLLAFMLLVESATWSGWLWWVLMADVVLLYGLSRRYSLFSNQIKQKYRGVVGRQILVVANTLLLLVVLSLGQLFVARPDYGNLTWQQTAMYAARQVDQECEIVSPLIRIRAIQQAWTEKAVHRGLDSLDSRWTQIMGWLLFFFWSGLSMWAWSRMLLGASMQKTDVENLMRTGCEH